MYHLNRDQAQAERRAWYYNWIITQNAYAKEVRLFGLGHFFRHKYREERKGLCEERFRLSVRRSIWGICTQLFSLLTVFGSYAYIGLLTVHGTYTPGDMVMFIYAFQRGYGYLSNMLKSLTDFYENHLFLSNLFDFLNLQPEIAAPEHPCRVPRPMKSGIRFEQVWFRYPAGKRPVLRNISLEIQPGEVIALVGANGSGKTSLIKLLCRLYDPLQGRITIDGIDLKQFVPGNLRQEISVIFQDFAQYHQTAGDNIRFGDIRVEPEDERIVSAAHKSGAHEVISGLPEGYDTMLGKFFRDGEELSIGQWQKIALARALLRNSRIIVLDEPASAMDVMSEYEIFRKFRELAEGRTAILISHRLSTVKMADRICVMEEGEIIEQGNHEELMCRKGLYVRMFDIQAQCYTI